MRASGLGRHGRLRVALNMNNAALVQKSGGTHHGPAIDIATWIGATTGEELEFVEHPNAHSVVEAATGGWDIAFLAVDPSRKGRISFSRPYHSVDATLLVRDTLSDHTCAELLSGDHAIMSAQGAAYHARLTAISRKSRLLVAASPKEARERFLQGECSALAGIRETLDAINVSDCIVLKDHFAKIEQAVAMPSQASAQMERLNQILLDFLLGKD